MSEVEDYYRRLLASGEWLGVNKAETPSGFISKDKNGPPRDTSDSNPRPKGKYSKPTDQDKTSDDPKRFAGTINRRDYKWCSKCWNRPSQWNKLTEAIQGRWSTTHFTDEHTGPVVGEPPATPKDDKPKVTFADALMAAQEGDGE